MNLNDIVSLQSGWLSNWFIFHDPFTFVAFFVFFTVTLASNKRAPFDLAEAESELVGGFHTEYSGMRWSFFFLAEYASMFFVSMLAVMLFLGGWWTGIAPIDNALVAVHGASPAWGYLTRVIGMVILLKKASLLVFVQIWIRWTLPRLRIDQVMATCLKYLIPISCAMFLGAATWNLALAAFLQRSNLGDPLGDRMPASDRTPAHVSAAENKTPATLSLNEHSASGGER
jgi:NADH-quinone oxidoreductase subunit H